MIFPMCCLKPHNLECLGSLCGALGLHLDPFGQSGLPLSHHLEHSRVLWLLLAVTWFSLRCIWVYHGLRLAFLRLSVCSGFTLDSILHMLLKYRACTQNLASQNLPTEPAESPEPAKTPNAENTGFGLRPTDFPALVQNRWSFILVG